MTDSAITRRRALALGGAATGALLGLGLASCSAPRRGSRAPAPDAASNAAPDGQLCVLAPSTTEGPYYLAGALFRRDITEGRKGVPLTVRLTVRDHPHTCGPLKGALVEIWQPDAWGYFSGYTALHPGGRVPAADTAGANPATCLRGCQTTGADGVAEFTTIFPGWYKSRAPHLYVKVHTGVSRTGRSFEGGRANWTGQLFFDDRYADEVYAKAPYTEHRGTRGRLARDRVYRGGGERDGLMRVTGNADRGLVASLTVGVDPTRENIASSSDDEGLPSADPSSPSSSTSLRPPYDEASVSPYGSPDDAASASRPATP